MTWLHEYDPIGNITHIEDDADIQNVVFFKNQRKQTQTDHALLNSIMDKAVTRYEEAEEQPKLDLRARWMRVAGPRPRHVDRRGGAPDPPTVRAAEHPVDRS